MKLNDASRYFEDGDGNLCFLKVRHPKSNRATICRIDGTMLSVDEVTLSSFDGHYPEHPQWKRFRGVWQHKSVFGV